jgi:ribosome maturation factor RimP
MTDSSRPEAHLDRARLDAVIAPVVRAHGGEVVLVEWKQEPSGWVLRVFVEKLGSAESRATTADAAVSLELCAGVARDLSPALDVADIIPHRYNLEVSSPGVERPLLSPRDYVRFAGQKARVKVREAVDGQKLLVGVLEAPPEGQGHEGSIAIREGAKLRVVPLDQVVSARLVFEFGPAPRPGKAREKRGKMTAKEKRAASRTARGPTPEPPGETSNS